TKLMSIATSAGISSHSGIRRRLAAEGRRISGLVVDLSAIRESDTVDLTVNLSLRDQIGLSRVPRDDNSVIHIRQPKFRRWHLGNQQLVAHCKFEGEHVSRVAAHLHSPSDRMAVRIGTSFVLPRNIQTMRAYEQF